MTVLDTEAIDHEIAMLRDEVAAMSATLMDLDDHPGLQHLRRYPPAGVTAAGWVSIERSLAQLWEDLGQATATLTSAEAVRARRSKPSAGDRTELMLLLCGLPELVDRLRGIHPTVVAFLDAVDEIDSLIADGLAPWRTRLDSAGPAGPAEIDLLAVSATDPLSLTGPVIAQRIAVIADGVTRRTVELAELIALKADWPRAISGTAERLDALGAATRRAAGVRDDAERTVVAGRLPSPVDVEPRLRAALDALSRPSDGAPDAHALMRLRHQIAAAATTVADAERLAQGLLDRRSELRGRLTVYQAKAARLGLGEERDLLACGRIASGLLSWRPCDLRAVTRAVNDFQQMVVEKRGEAR